MASTPEALAYPVATPDHCDAAPLERLANLIEQAHALIVHACGNSGESFRAIADSIHDAYLAAVLVILSEARAAARALPGSALAMAEQASNTGRPDGAAIGAKAAALGYRIGSLDQCGDSPVDRLTTRLAHAHVMVAHACGNSGESFRCLSDTMQDDYLFAVEVTLSGALADVAVLEHHAMKRAAAVPMPASGSAH